MVMRAPTFLPSRNVVRNIIRGQDVIFNPLSISGTQLYLDASDLTTITDVAGSVSQINDKSGNGNHAVQAVAASQPTTGTRTLNTLNALDFATDFLILPSALYSITAGPSTIFVVAASDVASGNSSLLRGRTAGLDTMIVRYSSTDKLRVRSGGAGDDQIITRDTGTHMAGCRRSGTSLDNVYDGSVQSTTKGLDATLDVLYIGASPVPSQYFNGIIGETVIYNRALTDTEMNQVGNHLAVKWGFTWTNI